MLPLHKLKEARKAAKVSKEVAAKRINKHADSITRIEEGGQLTDLEELASAYGCNIVVLSASEKQIIDRFWAILTGFVVKEGIKGE